MEIANVVCDLFQVIIKAGVNVRFNWEFKGF